MIICPRFIATKIRRGKRTSKSTQAKSTYLQLPGRRQRKKTLPGPHSGWLNMNHDSEMLDRNRTPGPVTAIPIIRISDADEDKPKQPISRLPSPTDSIVVRQELELLTNKSYADYPTKRTDSGLEVPSRDPFADLPTPSPRSADNLPSDWQPIYQVYLPNHPYVDSRTINSGENIPAGMTLEDMKENLELFPPQLQTLLKRSKDDIWIGLVEWFRQDKQELSEEHLEGGFGRPIPFMYGQGYRRNQIVIADGDQGGIERNSVDAWEIFYTKEH